MKYVKWFLPLFIGTTLLTSCATVIQGSYKDVQVISHTKGSVIHVDGDYAGKDEVEVSLRRKENHFITIEKEGCITKEIQINRKMQPAWVVADVVLWVYGTIVDALTGAWYTFDQDYIETKLHCPDEGYAQRQ